MKYYFILLETIITKDILYLKRYWINTIFNVCMLCVVFFVIAFSLNKFGGNQNALALFSGYIVWVYMTISFSSSINSITNEAALGTLEQLYINSKSLYITILMQGISSFLISFFQITFLILIVILFKGFSTHFFILYLKSVPILILGLPALWGMSFGLTAIALKYKNVSSIYTTLSSILFALISYFSSSFYSWKLVFLPFGIASHFVQGILINNSSLSLHQFILLIINGFSYFLIGLYLFKRYERISKKNAKFAHH